MSFQILAQQAQVDQHAQGHPVVWLRLELQQQIDPQPAVFEAQAPDHIVMALLQTVGDIATVDALQGRKIGVMDPIARYPVAQQV